MKLPFFKKADIFIFAVLLLLGAGSLLMLKTGPQGTTASVMVDGEVAATIQLTEEHQEYIIDTRYGRNTIAVESGTLWIKDADCRGGDCMRFSPISKAGQTIICLPHHMSIVIGGGSGDTPDVVVR